MKQSLKRIAMASVMLAAFAFQGSMVHAAHIDQDGFGFVGKGEVQSIFDWNNAGLQQNADKVQFRFVDNAGSYEWVCEWWTGPENNRKRHTQDMIEITGVSSAVGYDARKNKQGQITGFLLEGWNGASTSQAFEPYCTAEGNQMKTFVEGSLVALEGDGEEKLQVSVDGENWYDLVLN